jgi:hypothetical protein
MDSTAQSGAIGRAIGGTIAVILVILLALLFLRRRRLRNNNRSRKRPTSILSLPTSAERPSITPRSPLPGPLRRVSIGIEGVGRQRGESAQPDTTASEPGHGQLENGNRTPGREDLPTNIQHVLQVPSQPQGPPMSEDDALIQSISRTMMAHTSEPIRSRSPYQAALRLVGGNLPSARTNEVFALRAGSEMMSYQDIELVSAIANLIRAVRHGRENSLAGSESVPPAYTT